VAAPVIDAGLQGAGSEQAIDHRPASSSETASRPLGRAARAAPIGAGRPAAAEAPPAPSLARCPAPRPSRPERAAQLWSRTGEL